MHPQRPRSCLDCPQHACCDLQSPGGLIVQYQHCLRSCALLCVGFGFLWVSRSRSLHTRANALRARCYDAATIAHANVGLLHHRKDLGVDLNNPTIKMLALQHQPAPAHTLAQQLYGPTAEFALLLEEGMFFFAFALSCMVMIVIIGDHLHRAHPTRQNRQGSQDS